MRRISWIAALLLVACAPDIPPLGDPGVVPPETFAEAAGAARSWPDPLWWRGFGSPELDRLMTEALVGNVDIATAIARLRQADARARIAGAPLLPSLQASAGSGFTRATTGNGVLGDAASTRESYDLGLGAAWELDLWGGNRASLLAARQAVAASRYDQAAVDLTVTASVAQTYFQLLSLRDRLRIAEANLANAERVLALVQLQVANGAASPLDLAQQRTQVANQRAGLPPLRQQERQAADALALLLGRTLAGFDVEARSLAAVKAIPVRAGLPSGLLERRPDLQAAEARLAAAAADVGAARAALYPSISLTLDAGVASDALRSLLDSGNLVNLAFSVVAPIFEGGRLEGQVALSEAQEIELLQAYRGTILQAFADVEDALAAARSTAERERALGAAQAEARRAFSLAETQYRNGAIGLLDLLDAQRTLFATDDSLAGARFDSLASLVALYRALGGGWVRAGRPATS
jgi:NodT family efflux transporter outer membrane factor (OMF) lipoprotein